MERERDRSGIGEGPIFSKGVADETAGATAAGAAGTGPGGVGHRTPGRLFVVGTPLGNLGDLSPRAVEAFSQADVVCCEDTRVTSKLLAHAGVSKPLMRCDEHVIAARSPELVERVLQGETVAFASDAGMPGVSDPGQVLVDAALEAGAAVEVVPGPSACVTALVASGIPCEHFFFEGFLPRKAGERMRRLQRLATVPGALIFYESPHRTRDAVLSLAQVFPQRMVALCRELTKLHEEVLRAPAPELAELLRERDELKGEVVLVVAPPAGDELEALELIAARASAQMKAGAPTADSSQSAIRLDIRAALEAGESAAAVSKRLAQKYSLRKRVVYDMVLEEQNS